MKPIRSMLRRMSDWIVAHPLLWGVSLGMALVVLGVVLGLPPVVVVVAGAVIGALNIAHARRRGYCPLPPAQTRDPLRDPSIDGT